MGVSPRQNMNAPKGLNSWKTQSHAACFLVEKPGNIRSGGSVNRSIVMLFKPFELSPTVIDIRRLFAACVMIL